MNAVSTPVPVVASVGGDLVRIGASVAILLLVCAFWYQVASRLGVPRHEAVLGGDAGVAPVAIDPRWDGLHRTLVRVAVAFTVVLFGFCWIVWYAAIRWGIGYSP